MLAELATQDRYIDLLIPRGGEELKKALKQAATVSLLFAASGNCHVYVDASADPDMAESIAINAKTQRPAVCNAAEKLLVHQDLAGAFLPRILRALLARGVELRVDERVRALAPPDVATRLRDATAGDWDTEFLALIMGVAVVDSLEDAIAHINRHGSGHSEAIVARDALAARRFQAGVDSAAVYWNASTRFTDGSRFGMGAEMGISTQKLHARADDGRPLPVERGAAAVRDAGRPGADPAGDRRAGPGATGRVAARVGRPPRRRHGVAGFRRLD